jgi:hypothetical protein
MSQPTAAVARNVSKLAKDENVSRGVERSLADLRAGHYLDPLRALDEVNEQRAREKEKKTHCA